MGTIIQKLTKAYQSKNAIKDILSLKLGNTIFPVSTIFANYAQIINQYLVYPNIDQEYTTNGTKDVTEIKNAIINIQPTIQEISSVGSGNTQIIFNGVEKRPSIFAVVQASTVDLRRNYYYVNGCLYDGNEIHGVSTTLSGGNTGKSTISENFTWNYNEQAKTLTITSGSNTEGIFVSGVTYKLTCNYCI